MPIYLPYLLFINILNNLCFERVIFFFLSNSNIYDIMLNDSLNKLHQRH